MGVWSRWVASAAPVIAAVAVAGWAQQAAAPGSEQTFRIQPLRPVEELRREALRLSPPEEKGKRRPELVELGKLDPTIKLDIRYATSNNFLSTPFYEEARGFLQRPAAEALMRANARVKKQGYGLLVHDAYRPWYVTWMFWEATPEDKRQFVADPKEGSRHNRGCAVDISLYDLSTGREVEMPSGYDEMTSRSYADYKGGTKEQRKRRKILRKAMATEGFKVNPLEWWHFDYRGWGEWGIMNVGFGKIGDD